MSITPLKNTKHRSECGKFRIYTYSLPNKLKNGQTVYYKHVNVRKVIKSDKPRKSRKPLNLTDLQKKIEKRKLVNLLKNKILNNELYTLERTQKLFDFIGSNNAVAVC